MQPRCVQWAEINGRKHHIVGGKVAHAVANPTWNPIAKPGAISDFLRGNPNLRDPKTLLAEREPLPDYYMNNDARVAKLDEQGLEAMWLFPTLGVLYEELLKEDTDAVVTLFRAFNPLGQRGLGLQPQGSHLRGAVHLAVRTSTSPARSSSGRSNRTRARSCCDRPRYGPATTA